MKPCSPAIFSVSELVDSPATPIRGCGFCNGLMCGFRNPNISSGLLTFQYLPLNSNDGSSLHSRRMMSSASRVISRFCPDMPSTSNIAQSLGRPGRGDAEQQPALGQMVQHGDAVRQFRRVMIRQQEPARPDLDPLRLQQRLGDQQIGRRMRLPRRGVMLADPGLGVAEFIEPAQRLQVPVVAGFQAALRRMRRHREITEFHGRSPLYLVRTLNAQRRHVTQPIEPRRRTREQIGLSRSAEHPAAIRLNAFQHDT